MITPRCLAQDAVSWYLSHVDEYAPHAENVRRYFRGPIVALTVSILRQDMPPLPAGPLAPVGEESTSADVDCICPSGISAPGADPLLSNGSNKDLAGANWREYLQNSNNQNTVDFVASVDPNEYDSLSSRSKARLEAFLLGVSLAVPSLEQRLSENDPAKNQDLVTLTVHTLKTQRSKEKNPLSLIQQGLKGGGRTRSSSIGSSASMSSSLNKKRPQKCPQISESDLVTRLELYLRSLLRVHSLQQECVLALEPIRAIKARVHAVVAAFIETVSTVRQQAPVLTRLLTALTKEVLAVPVVSEPLQKLMRRLISDYEHTTSFASLAFLSTPENAADQKLTPLILQYLKYVRANWQLLVADCELELMLQTVLSQQLRHTFKSVEFQSIGHLLQVCHAFRSELQHIQLPPCSQTGEIALRQAVRDLKREVITVNGHVLPPVTSRAELIRLLSQTLNSSTLTASGGPLATGTPLNSRQRRIRRRSRKEFQRQRSGEINGSSTPTTASSSLTIFPSIDPKPSDLSSDTSETEDDSDDMLGSSSGHHRKFKLSTVDFLTKRLLLAGSRTGTGGDAYFVVRDLFGGDDVEVVPSAPSCFNIGGHRRETIEIILRLASITIRCHASFDVYPKSLVGSCEPLIQVHTTTQETITLQEVRVTDDNSRNSGGDSSVRDDGKQDDDSEGFVVREFMTPKTGWRTLSVRPALYEKVEVWNTPS